MRCRAHGSVALRGSRLLLRCEISATARRTEQATGPRPPRRATLRAEHAKGAALVSRRVVAPPRAATRDHFGGEGESYGEWRRAILSGPLTDKRRSSVLRHNQVVPAGLPVVRSRAAAA